MSQEDKAPFEMRGGRVVLGANVVLDDVDFRLGAGEFAVLLGGNGSGKTTLVRALLGLLPLARGERWLFGRTPARFTEWGRIGYVPQRFTAASGVPATVDEVVLSGRVARTGIFRRFTEADRAAAQRALVTLGMSELAGASVAELSGGQQQRTLIARALAAEPDVLVLDEPVAGVDLEHQGSFAVTLGELKREGRSVLLVAHALGVMEPLVDRSVVLQGGRVDYDGPPLAQQVQPAHAHHHPRERHRDHLTGETP
jgi:zinc transport system ATP-binding protein